MRRHGFLLSRHDTDLLCRQLHVDLLSLARMQRRRRRRRRRTRWLLGVLCVLVAIAALLWFCAR